MPEKSIIRPEFMELEKVSTRLALILILASGITFSTTSISNEKMANTINKSSHNLVGSIHSFWEKKRITVVGESLISYLPREAKRSERLVHSSFRLRQDVLKSLEVEARKRGVTLSSLVNNILENYMTSEIYFEELGFMLMSKGFLRKTFDEVTEKRAEHLGKDLGLTVAKEYVSYFFPEVNTESLIKFLELWFKRFQSYSHRIDNNRHYFTINHEININFSIILRAMLEGIIEPIAKRTVSFRELTPNTIAFSFEIN
ncbi:MAG: hypothetical protein ACTHKP_08435 [Nitrososphaeraceae archaeon]